MLPAVVEVTHFYGISHDFFEKKTDFYQNGVEIGQCDGTQFSDCKY